MRIGIQNYPTGIVFFMGLNLNNSSIITLFLIYLQIILSPDIAEKCVNNVDRDAYQAQH